MLRTLAAGVAFAFTMSATLLGPMAHAATPAPDPNESTKRWGVIERYCLDCHNVTDWAGGVAFDTMSFDALADDAKVWESAVRKLRAGFMPPPGAKARPDTRTVNEMIGYLETHLDAAQVEPPPGRVPLRRLNRREYANAVRDLIGLNADVAALLPADDQKGGFDNTATHLQVSPSFLDQYLSAARQIALQAVGDPKALPVTTTYGNAGDMVIALAAKGNVGAGAQQLQYEGMPFGTRGGIPHASGVLDPRPLYRRELELFMDSVLRSDQPVTALLTANYTYLNETLAMLYGMDTVKGGQFRRVTLPDSKRYGLLGKSAVLMLTANPDRTAPVLRGAWILDRILGTPPAQPPPGADTLEEKPRAQPATMRERMEQHAANPTCHSCHGVLDPLGFALENFDTVGQFRVIDPATRAPVDTSGTLPDGTQLSGPDDLRRALVSRSDQFTQALTERLMTYALGRNIDHRDMPTIRRIVRNAAQDGYRFASIVTQIVASDAFRKREPPPPAQVTTASATPNSKPSDEARGQ
jgi:hypothetical protein